MTSTRKVGRPNKDTRAREKLIHHACELFMVLPYDKVSTRKVAENAGVNIGMIRYYFGNKEGLFETMLRENLTPMQNQMQRLVDDSTQKNFLDIMRTYYREMIKIPKFPRLVAQVMHMPSSDTQRKLLEKVFTDISKPMQDVIFDKLIDSGVIRPDMDPKLCRISYISLMVFPFIAPPAMLAIHGIELNDQFLDKLLENNIKLMSHGFLSTDESQGQVNEN